jgi:Fe-S-cluster containining protein
MQVAHGLRHLRFHCTSCGNCCRRFRVPLTDADLARLANATGREPAELVEWLEPDAVDMVGEPESFVLLPQGRRLMTLAWQGDGCRFLEDNRCSVYAARPVSCRIYPFDVTSGRRGGVRRLRLLDLTGCEHEWARAQRQTLVANQAAQLRRELVAFARHVEAFNRRQHHHRRLGKPYLSPDDWYQTLRLIRPR